MPVLYRLADVFVLPSAGPGETWGLAANEAMASGLAVIVSDRCGCAADLIDERNGYVFHAGDKLGLMEMLSDVNRRKEKLAMQKIASPQKIKDFTFTHIASAMETAINE